MIKCDSKSLLNEPKLYFSNKYSYGNCKFLLIVNKKIINWNIVIKNGKTFRFLWLWWKFNALNMFTSKEEIFAKETFAISLFFAKIAKIGPREKFWNIQFAKVNSRENKQFLPIFCTGSNFFSSIFLR